MQLSLSLENYILENSSEEPALLTRLRKETYQKMIQPHMLSGVLQGRILSMISHLVRPKTILDIGTFTGYSALCLAEGLRKDGTLITLDKNPELRYLSEKYFKESKQPIQYIEGNALDIIPTLNETFDLVFLDADKDFYPQYIPLLIEKTKRGSLILADNTLWKGKIVEEQVQDKKTKALRLFNEEIAKSPIFEVVILPIRDGISVIRRI